MLYNVVIRHGEGLSCAAAKMPVDEIDILFYLYVVMDRAGSFPTFTVEDGAPFARHFELKRRAVATYPLQKRKNYN